MRSASLPYWLGAHRVFQHIRLPAKNARLTPAFRAAVTLARSPGVPVLGVPDCHEYLVLLEHRRTAWARPRPRWLT